MSKIHNIFSFAAILCILGLTASAATGQYGTKTPFPQQGLIQGVPNYSSNPFWNPNSQYNQRMPIPVYVQGTDLDTSDCQQVVAALVASFCNSRNNCRDTALDDARPTITIQLASLPNYNYVGSCAGYIDSEFASYKSKYSNAAVTNGTVAFPTATTPNPNANAPEFEMQNPYKSQLPSFYNDQWGQEILERKQELQNLQSANGAGNERLVRANFPTSAADVSFENRMRNEAAGYAPYADQSAYQQIEIESEEDYINRKQQIQNAGANNNPTKPNENESSPDKPDNLITGEDVPDELESLLPWYGILVVKKGSLDKIADSEVPIISSVYMKDHSSEFYPENSNRLLGMRRGCTHGNHTAHDKDVVNRAAHIASQEKDSFWTGNDYYVFDGEEVYWGTAQLIGEVALAILTFGVSTYGQAAAAAGQTISAASGMVNSVKLTRNASKINKAITAARAAQSGTSAAAVASRAEAVAALADAGITVRSGTRASQLVKIGNALNVANTSLGAYRSVGGLLRIGTTQLPATLKHLYGPGVTWGQRLKRAVIPAAVGGVGYELIKAFGYSTAELKDYADGVNFNSFGLLSADDLEGRENQVAHGAWLQFEEVGALGDDEALVSALEYADDFHKNMVEINKQEQLCDVDIYVVQPGISNPKKLGKREIYYLIQNPAGSLRVSTNQ